MEFGPELRDGLTELFRWRRDVRRFRSDPVCPTLLRQLLAQADLAPSVGLSQPWRWVLVESHQTRNAIRDNFDKTNAEALRQQATERQSLYARLKLEGLETAPVHLAVFCDETTEQGAGLGAMTMPEMRRYSVVCAIFQLWLAARAAGIGMGWVSILDPTRISRDLGTPETWHFVAYLCIGYPADDFETPELERAGWETRRSVPIMTR